MKTEQLFMKTEQYKNSEKYKKMTIIKIPKDTIE